MRNEVAAGLDRGFRAGHNADMELDNHVPASVLGMRDNLHEEVNRCTRAFYEYLAATSLELAADNRGERIRQGDDHAKC